MWVEKKKIQKNNASETPQGKVGKKMLGETILN